jgi:formate dehydrogenase maturation protein FdhE
MDCIAEQHSYPLLVSSPKQVKIMAKCTGCGNEVEKPSKELSNDSFTVDEYFCSTCHNWFKIVR